MRVHLPLLTGFALLPTIYLGTQTPTTAQAPTPDKPVKLTFSRAYKIGDLDSYKFKLVAGATNLTANFTDSVTQVYGDGKADISEKTTDATMSMSGGPSQPAQGINQNISFKVSPFGLVIGNVASTPAGWILFTLAVPGDTGGLALNESASFKRVLGGTASAAEQSPTIEGKATLVAISDGIAKLKIEAKLTPPPTVQGSSGTVNGTLLWDTKLGRYIEADLTVLNGTQTAVVTVQRNP